MDVQGRKTVRPLNRRSLALLAGVSATALVLAACGEDNGDGEEPGGGASGSPDAMNQEITIGAFNGWEEGIAATYLWKAALEENGYQVTVEFADVGPLYLGMSEGDYDVGFDAWLPATHKDYWEQYGDNMEDLGAWFEDAPLTIAVNEDAPIQSLTELAENADAFDNRLVGIDPGAGLTRITKENVIPTYGLEDMQFIESSTPAMIAELSGAIDRGDNVVVTLWQPHWAYDAFPIRNLEDPEGALGEPEEIHSFARSGFSADFPEAAGWISNFTFSAEQLQALENILFNEMEASTEEQYEAGVQQWLGENPDFLTQLTS